MSSALLLAAWAWLVVLAALACHHERAAAATLSTSSRWIVDERARRVKLACVNWPSHLEPMLAEGLGKRPLGAIAGDVAAMGFNCVRLTWPTFLVTDASRASLTVAQSLQRLNLTESLAGVQANNPGILDLKLIDAFKAVVSSLGDSDVMVILDNHVSKPGWCCGRNDGNGFFGDAYFDPGVWVDGLTKMAAMFAGVPNVVGMSLRNELRGPRQNTNDWYRYMQRGAEAVHAANPRVLVILSGLSFDNDLAFLSWRQVRLSFARKVAFEVHWYSFSNPHQWTGGNANRVCARIAASVARRSLYLLNRGWPVFLSEFGVDNRGGNVGDNRYWGCVAAVAAGLDLDWALWTLQGSYYLRDGVPGHDEAYGVLDRDWRKARNETALRRIHALQRPFRGPGLAEAAPYTVLFHPATGLCVVQRSLMRPLELGPCNETAAWAYTPEHRLVLRDSSLLTLCLRAEGAGRPARLGLGRVGCAGSLARWLLVSDSKLHVAVHASSSRSDMRCLDVGADGRTVVTNRCRCLSGGNSCDPESQWFKLVSSTRSPVTNNILAQLLLVELKNWKSWLFNLF
ncbi:glycosyl hydrolase 5 family protein-like [Phragmites australis]|uniref:glycosyl hydrolase 5 family protein-like n=1 Tax=Phragmites australis TaxID=29695 RepID=UPI002D790AB2|nr:glycosyl hydrolase 5 family protein-like [Phragmites australis]